VIPILRLSLIAFFLSFSGLAHAVQGFQSELDQDVVMKHQFPIYIQHRLGNVSVSGWVQDRIRVKIKYRMLAETSEQADREFKKLSLITFEGRDRFELRMGHSQGVDLVSKMRDQAKNLVQVDLEIKAPYQSDLTVILADGKSLKLDQWRGGVTVNGKNNSLQFSKLSLNRPFWVSCIQCETEIRDSKLNGRVVVGSRPVVLSGIETPQGLSIDEGNEEVRVDHSVGDISVHSKAGRLSVLNHKGKISFQSDEGGAYLSQLNGGVNILTQSGQVMLDFEEVSAPVNVDTDRSDIQVSLIPQHEGTLDLMSLRGEVIVQFPYESKKALAVEGYGPPSPGRVDGVIGAKKGFLIHAYSKQGGVRILRKAPAK
jgi:hypothetical protein